MRRDSGVRQRGGRGYQEGEVSDTYKDKKAVKHKAYMANNGPASFKKDERRKRRAESKQALREGKEPAKAYVYSQYYW